MKARLSLALLIFLSMAVGVIAGQVLIPRPVHAIQPTAVAKSPPQEPLTDWQKGQLITECFKAGGTGAEYCLAVLGYNGIPINLRQR